MLTALSTRRGTVIAGPERLVLFDIRFDLDFKFDQLRFTRLFFIRFTKVLPDREYGDSDSEVWAGASSRRLRQSAGASGDAGRWGVRKAIGRGIEQRRRKVTGSGGEKLRAGLTGR